MQSIGRDQVAHHYGYNELFLSDPSCSKFYFIFDYYINVFYSATGIDVPGPI